jgi:hypothetical protein
MSKHYIIHGLGIEIFYKDLPPHKKFMEYNSLCLALRGDGWRAPTLIELGAMYEMSKLGVMGFDRSMWTTYWSGDIPLNTFNMPIDSYRKCIHFDRDNPEVIDQNININYKIKFRPVRSI